MLRRKLVIAPAVGLLLPPAGRAQISLHSSIHPTATSRATDVEVEFERCKAARAWLSGATVRVPPVTASRAEVTFRVSAHPKADAWVVKNVFEPSFDALHRMSSGRIVVDAGWGESRHRAQDGYAAIVDGRTDFAPCYTAWDAERYPMSQLLALPGLFPTSEIATAASEALYEEFLRAEFERPGIVMGRLKATGPYHLFSRKPLKGLPDVVGLKVATSAGIDSRIVEALGGVPVALSSVELFPAFTDGRVDAVSLADGSGEVFGIGARSLCRLEIGTSMLDLEFGLRAAFVAGLDPALRIVLNDWLRAEAQAETQYFYGYGGTLARRAFAHAGCRFVDLSASERDELGMRMADLTDRIAAETDARGLPGRRFVRAAREFVRRAGSVDANTWMSRAIEHPRWLLPGSRPTLRGA